MNLLTILVTGTATGIAIVGVSMLAIKLAFKWADKHNANSQQAKHF